MKTSTLSNKFFKAYENYFRASKLLLDNINYMNSPDIIYPAAFLLRHSAELLIKSLICDFVNEQNILIDKRRGIFLDVNGNKHKLEGHSLLFLYDELIKIASSNLVPLMNKDFKLRKKIERFSKQDNNSEYFRYPISKNSRSSNVVMYSLAESDIAPDISKTMNINVLTGTDNPILIKNLDKKVHSNIKLLNEIIDTLINYSRYKNMDKNHY